MFLHARQWLYSGAHTCMLILTWCVAIDYGYIAFDGNTRHRLATNGLFGSRTVTPTVEENVWLSTATFGVYVTVALYILAYSTRFSKWHTRLRIAAGRSTVRITPQLVAVFGVLDNYITTTTTNNGSGNSQSLTHSLYLGLQHAFGSETYIRYPYHWSWYTDLDPGLSKYATNISGIVIIDAWLTFILSGNAAIITDGFRGPYMRVICTIISVSLLNHVLLSLRLIRARVLTLLLLLCRTHRGSDDNNNNDGTSATLSLLYQKLLRRLACIHMSLNVATHHYRILEQQQVGELHQQPTLERNFVKRLPSPLLDCQSVAAAA